DQQTNQKLTINTSSQDRPKNQQQEAKLTRERERERERVAKPCSGEHVFSCQLSPSPTSPMKVLSLRSMSDLF
ncbi:unnamed protein product, partial [Prunus brigantina]